MKKSYESHEIAYQKMRQQGVKQWGVKGSGTKGSFSYETKRFLKDVLSQPWAPKGGRAIEFGCGTGPIIRWICERRFRGVGLDVSKTAIAMAKEQSEGLDIRFRKADVCNLNTNRLGKFDLVVDGHCYHCITDTYDRKVYLQTAYDILKPGGLLVLMTMCAPIDREQFRRVWRRQKLHKKIVYFPLRGSDCEGRRTFAGQSYMPTRYITHWKDILKELRAGCFEQKLIRYNAYNYNDAVGTLTVGAVKAE